MANPQQFGLGYRKDPAHRRTQKSSHMLLGASPTYPASASLEKFEAPIEDQGPLGACVGHGSSQGVYTSLKAAGKPLPWVPSPLSAYRLPRQIERAASLPAFVVSLPALVDGGAMPSDAMVAYSTIGMRPMGPKVEGRNSDADSTNVNTDEDVAGFEADGATILTGEYRIDENNPTFIAQMCAALAGTGSAQNGVPCAVGIGVFVDSAVMNWSAGDAALVSADFNDPDGGGHWIAITSYRTENGKVIFRIANSWGINYGSAGHFEITEDWMRQQATQGCDIYPLHVSAVTLKGAQ